MRRIPVGVITNDRPPYDLHTVIEPDEKLA
jgi:hypothetical protein